MSDKQKELRKRINRMSDPKAKPAAPMVVNKVAFFKATADEIRTACKSNAEHPKAVELLAAIDGMPDTAEVTIELPDLQAVMDNKEVVETVKEELVNGQMSKVRRKKLVKMQQPPEDTDDDDADDDAVDPTDLEDDDTPTPQGTFG